MLLQPVQLSKMESVSSIGPLQLSPRGLGVSRNWKTSSPLILTDISIKNQSPYFKSDKDFEKMLIESKMQSQIDSKQTEISELKLEIDILKRQLVEMSQELDNSKSQTKEIQQELETRDEDIRKLKNNETNLIMTIESLKSNHMEEIEEFQNKLSFERKKVEKVYEDIRALEVKKIEIEEAFLSLKEDYGEKLNGEQKMVKILMEKIKDLEFKNCNAERKFTNMKEETDAILKESNEAMKLLNKELSDLKKKNEALKMLSKNFSDAQVQVNDNDTIKIFQNNQVIGMPKLEGESILLKQNFEMLKSELDKMTDTVTEVEFNRKEAFSYLNGVKNLLSTIFSNIDELITELETHRKKVMESSVDELAVKVQKELILSAKLDNELLSSIEAKGFTSENQVGETIQVINEQGGGDSIYLTPKQGNSKINHENESVSKIITMYQEATKTITALENERDELLNKVQDHQNIIKFLEENLLAEKERIVAEKERCKEDAKIMELLRINLEKGLLDIKLKDKDLRKEKQLRIMLEREVEACKKQMVNVSESRKIVDLNSRLDSQEEKLASLNRNLDSEKLKNQELRLLLEQNKIERISEKEAQRLLESDFNLLREQNENLKDEVCFSAQFTNLND